VKLSVLIFYAVLIDQELVILMSLSIPVTYKERFMSVEIYVS
jgi:hypothetical protein